jgi:hypothetical protein
MRMFDMSNDSHLFSSRRQLEEAGWRLEGNIFIQKNKRMLPLYEAKMLHHYDHRWATYDLDDTVRNVQVDEKQSTEFVVQPRYWVSESDAATERIDQEGNRIYEAGTSSRLSSVNWRRDWLLGWRDICRSTDERTAIASILPRFAVGHKFLLEFPSDGLEYVPALYAARIAFVFDYVSRQKIGGTSMGYFVWKQLPAPVPGSLGAFNPFILRRVMELVYTNRQMSSFAEDFGDAGDPFVWDDERRFVVRAELDALFFHLYGIERDNVDYIMETFPIVKRKDIAKFGSFRTKEMILEVFDQMVAAGMSAENPPVDGENFFSQLDPPPGHGPRHSA